MTTNASLPNNDFFQLELLQLTRYTTVFVAKRNVAPTHAAVTPRTLPGDPVIERELPTPPLDLDAIMRPPLLHNGASYKPGGLTLIYPRTWPNQRPDSI